MWYEDDRTLISCQTQFIASQGESSQSPSAQDIVLTKLSHDHWYFPDHPATHRHARFPRRSNQSHIKVSCRPDLHRFCKLASCHRCHCSRRGLRLFLCLDTGLWGMYSDLKQVDADGRQFAVATVMIVTTSLIALSIPFVKHLSFLFGIAFFLFFGFIDGLFWGASLKKVPLGAWFPLGLGSIL